LQCHRDRPHLALAEWVARRPLRHPQPA